MTEQTSPQMVRKIILHNDVSETPLIAEFMDDIMNVMSIDVPLSTRINLALEEAVVNVMNYAYPEGEVGEIRLEAFAENGGLRFVIADKGCPFDPTASEEPDVTAGIDDRAIGGLGIFLVRHIMDNIHYERVGGQNVLTLWKKLNKTKPEG